MSETHEMHRKAAERVIADVWSIGKTWARYGLNAGQMALDASATTLHKTASLLEDLSKSLERKAGETTSTDQPPADHPTAS